MGGNRLHSLAPIRLAVRLSCQGWTAAAGNAPTERAAGCPTYRGFRDVGQLWVSFPLMLPAWIGSFWFTDQQIKVFGHDHVTHDHKLISLPHLLWNANK